MTSPDMSLIRSEIDAIDRQIVALIGARQRWVVEAGRAKRGLDAVAVQAPARVEEVVAKVRALAEDSGASPDVVERAYRAMIAGFIDLELGVHGGTPVVLD